MWFEMVIGAFVAAGIGFLASVNWWIAGSVGLLAAVGLYLLSRHNWATFRAERAKIVETGQIVKCWIIRANSSLYRKSLFDAPYDWADVVFTFETARPNLDQVLLELAQRVASFRPGRDATEDELRVARVMSIELPKPSRTPLPTSITGGMKAYMVGTQVMRELLPEGKLTRPYIWAVGLTDNPEGGVVMVPYSESEASG
ncbi:MAG: hypothetical protein HYS12_07535 [Planctomycetes bacterium]|nr:hypothetical protein [Planctomycetota bacterium]